MVLFGVVALLLSAFTGITSEPSSSCRDGYFQVLLVGLEVEHGLLRTIYSVMSYLVGQRTREMGIRLALGATPGGVRALVMRRAVLLSSIGMGIGVAGSLLLGRLLTHELRGVSGADPLSFGASVGVLFLVTASASTVPAWRASRTDPAITLREE